MNSTPPAPGTISPEALHDLAQLALLIAHGADSDLDPREIDTIADRLLTLDEGLSGDDVIVIFRHAAEAYAQAKVTSAEDVVARLARVLDGGARERAFALLRAVAEADEVIHPMESTLLRHIADAWGIGPAFMPHEDAPDGA
jgi:uncharacterized tellurite resistance protein B-like protein